VCCDVQNTVMSLSVSVEVVLGRRDKQLGLGRAVSCVVLTELMVYEFID